MGEAGTAPSSPPFPHPLPSLLLPLPAATLQDTGVAARTKSRETGAKQLKKLMKGAGGLLGLPPK